MPRFLVINGPNLNNLGGRDPAKYGTGTLADLEAGVAKRAEQLGVDVAFYQSNHEGAIVDYIQAESGDADGVVINAGALSQVGYSILDALLDTGLPVVEVHITNVHAREEFRQHSVIAPFAVGQIVGLGTTGYVLALEFLAAGSK